MLIINRSIFLLLSFVLIHLIESQRPIPYPISGYGSSDQVTLYAGDGNIKASSGVLYYTFPTIRMQNVQQTGLVLCGFNIKNEYNLQYSADVVYSQSSNQFNVSLQDFNDTQLAYISFFVLMYSNTSQSFINVRSGCLTCTILNNNPNTDRNQTLNLTLDYTAVSGIQLIYSPYIKSMKARGGTSGYTRLQVSFRSFLLNSNSAMFNLYTYQSLITQACITVLIYHASFITNNKTINIYAQTFSFSIRQYDTASLKAQSNNFNITNTIYGPTFNGKCVIGLSQLYFKDRVKQIFFDVQNVGITTITQNTPGFFSATYLVYCTVKFASCNTSFGINTITQNCTSCTSMISYCLSCNTQELCLSCSASYFVDVTGGCCPSYMNNCKACSLADVCIMCSIGYYLSENASCVACGSKIQNCNTCYNSTKCSFCDSGYILSSQYKTCKLQSSSSSGLSLLEILLISALGFFILVFLLLLIYVIKMRRSKQQKPQKKLTQRVPSQQQTERRSQQQLQIQSASSLQRKAMLNNVDDRQQGFIQLKMSQISKRKN